jgi:2-polyprenyl-3-methyl-5-hydroxy-6-metoxy-1,4-benzoquinol methylase
MSSLSKKFIRHLKEKGLAATVKKIGSVSLKKLVARPQSLQAKLAEQINQHNQSYATISRLVLEMNNGIHPKHTIINYHQYFLDRVESSDLILDIGCGNGYLAYDLAHKAKEVIGIDILPANIAFAQANYQKNNLRFLVGDATTYTYGKTADKIILSNVLEHIEKRQAFLDSLHRIAPLILLRVPLLTRDWLAFYKKENGFEYRLDQTHFIEYRPEELIAELEKSNWRVESFQINWGEFWGKISSSSL